MSFGAVVFTCLTWAGISSWEHLIVDNHGASKVGIDAKYGLNCSSSEKSTFLSKSEAGQQIRDLTYINPNNCDST